MKFFFVFFFEEGGGGAGGVILGENFSRWGQGMSKFLAGGGHVRYSRHVRYYQNMFKKLYKKVLP